MESLYPAGPKSVPASLAAASATYRRQAWVAMMGLLAFMGLYLGLLCWFAWTAYRLVSGLLAGSSGDGNALLSLLTAGCAAFLAFFMAKALVFRKRTPVSQIDIELKPQDQPELFAFLHRLADEARAPRPHKVFLSPRVNASVSYDLSLLNLVLPSRKNLEIGLGLLNVLNLGEMKAVLAHEFGHFAQRTMAVGRWVYVAQQIATHIVARRDALDTLLATLSRLDFRIAWIGWSLSLIVWSIRSLVEILFRWVVLAQRALSREMEFQADLVAASLTGSDALVHALHRLGAADEAWDRALQFAGREAGQGRPVADVFAVQTRIIELLRAVLDSPDYGSSPSLPDDRHGQHRIFSAELAPPPQMWATHPPSDAREANVKRTYVACDVDPRPALQLLRDAQALKETLSRRLLKEEPVQFAPIDTSLQHLEREYSALALSRRYRGAYLGRSFVRPHASVGTLYEAVHGDGDLLDQIDTLYSPACGEDIERLRELEQQYAQLEAIRDARIQTQGGMVNWRGSQVPRKALPGVLVELERELLPLRQSVEAHDRRCRSLHLAVAEQLGAGWPAALRGQLGLLHYVEHAQADVTDAEALLENTFQIVTADNRVSTAERRRLVAACNQVYAALDTVYAQARHIILDERISAGLGVASWPEMLEQPLGLPRATEENLSGWMKAVGGWVGATRGALSALRHATLEALLATEDDVVRQRRTSSVDPAPTIPASAPPEYLTLLPGKGRRLQHKLGWWDRFQLASGVVPATARLTVAGGIVGAVLTFGGAVGHSTLTVFNGLARSMQVEIDGKSVTVPAFESVEMTLPSVPVHSVRARTADSGEPVEDFKQDAPKGSAHLVYNIAGAAPLVQWTASYGQAAEAPERRLGSPRWTTTQVDHVFSEPPQSISSRSGSGHRTVLSAVADAQPGQVLDVLPDDAAQRKNVTAMRARWDAADSRHLAEWMWRAKEQGVLAGIVQQRLRQAPAEVMTLRMEQELAEGEEHAAVCARHHELAARSPQMSSLQYVIARCIEDETARDEAFLHGHQRWPQDAWFAMAAGYVQAERQQWQPALVLLEQGSAVPGMIEGVIPDVARLQRQVRNTPLSELRPLAAQSNNLKNMLELEAGVSTRDTPYIAYHHLQRGELDQAVQSSRQDAATTQRIVRLAAASQGADPRLVAQALAMPAGQGIDEVTVWTSLALAMREHRDVGDLRATARASDKEDAADMLRFIDALQAGASPQAAEAALGSVSLRARGLAYSAAAVLQGDRCPSAWRETAKRLLFAPERPYFG